MPASTVLVGIDFSDPAGWALDEARCMADRLGAGLAFVHVTSNPHGWTVGSEAREWLERRDVDPGALRVRRGTPWVELSRHGAEIDAVLIAVGTHGRRGYQSLSLGSTANRLTLAATRPVLVVGQRIAARTLATAAGHS